MPYARPTLLELRQQALQDINNSDLTGVDGLLRRSVLRVMSWVMAGFAYLHYDYQDWIAKQATPWGAEDEFAAGWGQLKGVERKDATAASGPLSWPGTVGTSVPSGTSITRADGVLYTTTAPTTVAAGGAADLTIQAVEPGVNGNADAGTKFYLTNGITGLASEAVSTADISGGADQESEADYKTRYLEVYSEPPQGGAETDYKRWAREVAGVTRAWVNPNGAGAGTVVVYTMFDEANAADGGFPQGTDGVATDEPRGVPATGDQLAVANHIQPLRPVTALVYSVAPNAQSIDFALDDVSSTNDDTQSAVEEALEDMFRRLGDPTGATIYPSDWNDAIRSVLGMKHFTVLSPSGPVTTPLGSLPTLGTVTLSS
ncbi:baseplate J/gp47 family protein [Roseomonas chloroacetimidivorans]|uniref:baseplate J/gp47 family protein n=1 Tax=Roseomonas chloroacetimidivorans TaxID=1766656 RepID=UPI003C744B0B